MKKHIYFIFILCLISCKNNPESFIAHINGYWEINNVEMSHGEKRNYTFNETIDFFSVTDSLNGFRKKLTPKFDGSYETSKDSEQIILEIKNDSLRILYKTPYATWEETVLKATKTELKIITKEKTIYTYKRYIPLNSY